MFRRQTERYPSRTGEYLTCALSGGSGPSANGCSKPFSTQDTSSTPSTARSVSAASTAHSSLAAEQGAGTRPALAPAAPPQKPATTLESKAYGSASQSPSAQSSSDASRAPTATSHERAAAQARRPAGTYDASGAGGPAAGENPRRADVASVADAGQRGPVAHAPSSSSSQGAALAQGSASAPPERPREVDVEQLRRMIATLREDTAVQPFSSMDFYSFGRTLGQGAYGKVKLGSHLLTGEKVAVKTFEKSKLTEAHARKRVSREIRILKALNHPNIIKLYEVVDVPLRKFLIMQYSSGGDLCRYVRCVCVCARGGGGAHPRPPRARGAPSPHAFPTEAVAPLHTHTRIYARTHAHAHARTWGLEGGGAGRTGGCRSRRRAGSSARLWRGCSTATCRAWCTAT